MSDRADYTASLRKFADWLDANPDVPPPVVDPFLLPLHTNVAVREFAARYSLDVKADADGNLSAEISIGVVRYLAYGYADFDQHVRAGAERQARKWAEGQGLELVARTAADDPNPTRTGRS